MSLKMLVGGLQTFTLLAEHKKALTSFQKPREATQNSNKEVSLRGEVDYA